MKTRLNNFARQVTKSVVVRRPGEGHDAAVIGRNRRLVEADIAEVMTQLAVAVERFILLQEAHAVLGDKNAARIQATLTAFIKGGGKQAFAGAYRIGTVGNDHIKGLMGLIDEIHAVVDH